MATSGNTNKVYWRMKNGRMIDVNLMDVNHLRNVLKMIIRNNQKVQNTCPHNATQALDMENIDLEVSITDIETDIL